MALHGKQLSVLALQLMPRAQGSRLLWHKVAWCVYMGGQVRWQGQQASSEDVPLVRAVGDLSHKQVVISGLRSMPRAAEPHSRTCLYSPSPLVDPHLHVLLLRACVSSMYGLVEACSTELSGA